MSFVAALLAAVLFGIGTVLEATAARQSDSSDELDPRLLLRMMRQGAFAGSAFAGIVGVIATAVALRHLPLFVVQATVASSVGFAAVLAAKVHHERIDRVMLAGLIGIVGGLGVLAFASKPEGPPVTSMTFRWGLLVMSIVLLAASRLAGRRRIGSGVVDVAVLGGLAGALYGIGNIALRVVDRFTPGMLVANPAAWAAVCGALGGVVVLATALQRGSVAVASGAMTTAETLFPTLVGVLVLGERPRHGWAAPAIIGFALAVAGSIILCRDAQHGAALAPDVPDAEVAR